MSATRDTVRDNINAKIRNFAGTKNIVNKTVLNESITSHMQTMAAQMGLTLAWSTSAITTTAGDRDYALGATAEYHSILALRCQSSGQYLRKTTPEGIEKWRRGPGSNQGEPVEYALLEAAPSSAGHQEITVVLGPTPNAAYVYDILRSTVPIAMTEDTDEIPFGEVGLRALELYVAAELIETAPDEHLAEAGLSRSAARAYARRADSALYWEKVRVARQRRNGRIPSQFEWKGY